MLDLSSLSLDCTVKFRGIPTWSVHRTFQPFLDGFLTIFTFPNIAVIRHTLRETFLLFVNSPNVSWCSLAPLTTSVTVHYPPVCLLTLALVGAVAEKTFLFVRVVPDWLKWYLRGSTVQGLALQWGLSSLILLLANSKNWDYLLLVPVFWYIAAAASSVQFIHNAETSRFKTDWIRKQCSHPRQ